MREIGGIAVLVVLCSFLLFNLIHGEEDVLITLRYLGGGIDCNSTDCNDDKYFEYYKCISLEEPSLVTYFHDPVPEHFIVTSIYTTLFGMFGCSTENPELYLTIDDGPFSPVNSFPNSTSDCKCNNCAVALDLSPIPHKYGWPGYQYGGKNSVTLGTTGNYSLCVNEATLTISYRPSDPQIENVIPNMAPIASSENDNVTTTVHIYGSDFIPTDQPLCLFGDDQEVLATYIDYNNITCVAPKELKNQTVNLSVVFSNSTVINTGTFTFYQEPTIEYIQPSSGPAVGGVDVYLIGSNFITSTLAVCRFGVNELVEGKFVNTTAVMCVNPRNIQNTEMAVQVSYSVNHNNFIVAPDPYTFLISSPSPTPISPPYNYEDPTNTMEVPGYIWAALGVSMLMIIILLSGGLLAMIRSLRKKREFYDPLLSPINGSPSSSAVPSTFMEYDPSAISILEITNWKQIEKGSFGVIYQARWRGTRIAVKRLPSTSPSLLQDFLHEASLMRSLRHPNILQYLGIAPSEGEISICMEFMAKGSLYRLLHSNSDFSRSKIKSICLDAAKGMNYLHQRSPPIIHRDLKSHNLLVDENWRVKVCDFGLSKLVVKATSTMTACGTPSWTAPEVLRNERYTFKADVYSFGVVIWEMFARADPFPKMPAFQIVFAVGNQNMRPRINPSWPAGWIELITTCWHENPDKRPSFEQTITTLEDLPIPADED